MSDALDKHWPPRGPCTFCAHRDARHRVFDAIKERRRAGESIVSLCYDYDRGFEAIVLALEWEDDTPAPPTIADKPPQAMADEFGGAYKRKAQDQRNPSPSPEEP